MDHPVHPQHRPHLNNGSLVVAIGKQVISFLLGVVVAAYLFGGKTQQFTDMLSWKDKVDLRLERMDNEGTHASKNTLLENAKEFGRDEARIDKIEEESRKIDTLIWKVEGLTKTVEDLKAQPKR